MQTFKLLAFFCACTARFVWDLFGKHIVGFFMTRLNYSIFQDVAEVKIEETVQVQESISIYTPAFIL